MSILSFEFLCFSVLLLIAYYAFPLKWRPWVLLTFSILFVYLNSLTDVITLFTQPKVPTLKVLIPLGVLVLTVLTFAIPFKKPQKWRPCLLIAASLALVIASGAVSLIHISVLTFIVWGGARGLLYLNEREKEIQAAAKTEDAPKSRVKRVTALRRCLLALLLVLDLGAMLFIKFYPSVAQMLNAGWIRSNPLPIWDLIMPLGLSYFSFQAAGYLIDVFWGKVDAPKNPLNTLLFVAYFPQLIQGPISTWKELQKQLITGHRFDQTKFVSGFQLMLWGYFKKMIIADRLALVTTEVLRLTGSLTGWLSFGTAIVYVIRLYTDFSGGLDVMCGLSRMVGVELPKNFRRPFFSTSVAEYWRRWHITMGVWFRTYLLYPLTAGRFGLRFGHFFSSIFGKKTGRTMPAALTTILVFVTISLWHGLIPNALYYGLYFGLLMAATTLLAPFWKRMNKALHLPKWIMTPFCLIRTWLLITIPQFFAITDSTEKALFMMEKAFSPIIYYWNGIKTWVAHLFTGMEINAAQLFSAQEAFKAWRFNNFASLCTRIMSPLEWTITGSALLILLVVDLLCDKDKNFCDKLAEPKRFYIRWPLLALLIVAILVFGCYGQGYDSAAFLYAQF